MSNLDKIIQHKCVHEIGQFATCSGIPVVNSKAIRDMTKEEIQELVLSSK